MQYTPTVSESERLGRYRIIKELGRGGMGLVYQAEDEMLGRVVALKTVTAAPAQAQALHDRLLREARLSARLDHPCVIRLHDIGTHEGLTFLVLEYVDGRTLRDILTDVGSMRMSDALRIFRDVVDGVAHAHDLGIVHRDLKPENVMITAQGRAKVMDFGLAWQADQVHLTRTGAIMGTLAYFSPEQARGETADARSDLYSLGAILFELVTGQLVFDARSPAEMVMHHLQTPPRAMRDLSARVPPELDAIALRCLQKDPGQRIQSARDLLAALDSLRDLPALAPRPGSAPPAAPPSAPGPPPTSVAPSVPPALQNTAVWQTGVASGTATPAANPQWGAFQRQMARMEAANITGQAPATAWGPLQRAPAPAPPAAETTVTESFESEYRRGKAALEARRLEEAEQHLQAAIRHNGKDARPYRHLAALYQRQGRTADALKACQTGLALAPEHARMRALLGDVLAAGGSVSEAIAAWQEAVRRRPDLVDAWRAMGRLCADRDRVQEAIRAFEAVLAQDGRDLEALRTLPGLYLRSSNPSRAEQTARAALKLAPKDVSLRIDLARALEGQKNPVAAVAALKEATGLDPSAIAAWEALVRLHVRQGQTVAARAVLDEAMERHPYESRLRWQNGELLVAEGNQNEALFAFERALECAPAVASALQGIAGADAAAIPALQDAVLKNASDARAAAQLGRLLLKGRQTLQASQVLQRAVDATPGDLLLHLLLGQARRLSGQKDAAIRSYRRAWERAQKR